MGEPLVARIAAAVGSPQWLVGVGLRERVAGSRLAPVMLGLACVLFIWWALAEILPREILPGPLAVSNQGMRLLTEKYVSETLIGHIGISLWRVLMGFALGTLVGTVIGFLIFASRELRPGIEFVLALLLPLPPFTLIAVFIIWFGLGETPKIALIFFGVFGRMAIYAAAAFRSLPDSLHDAARALGASPWQILLRVRIPAALPDLFVGLRILLALAWTSVMGAELIAAGEGIGWMIWTAARNLQTEVIFVGVLAIAVMGALMDAVLVGIAGLVTGGWASRIRGN
jgi:ABC-type nitrate/sulfonate/bicarbonate transport system permease component